MTMAVPSLWATKPLAKAKFRYNWWSWHHQKWHFAHGTYCEISEASSIAPNNLKLKSIHNLSTAGGFWCFNVCCMIKMSVLVIIPGMKNSNLCFLRFRFLYIIFLIANFAQTLNLIHCVHLSSLNCLLIVWAYGAWLLNHSCYRVSQSCMMDQLCLSRLQSIYHLHFTT